MAFRWIVRQCFSLSKAIRKHIVSVSYLNIHLPSLILNAATDQNCTHAFSWQGQVMQILASIHALKMQVQTPQKASNMSKCDPAAWPYEYPSKKLTVIRGETSMLWPGTWVFIIQFILSHYLTRNSSKAKTACLARHFISTKHFSCQNIQQQYKIGTIPEFENDVWNSTIPEKKE